MAEELKKEEKTISAGGSCFLIKDESLLKGWGSPVYRWLYDNGFVSWGTKGVYKGVDWVFVNPYSKVFAPGLRGAAEGSWYQRHSRGIKLGRDYPEDVLLRRYDGLGRSQSLRDLLPVSERRRPAG